LFKLVSISLLVSFLTFSAFVVAEKTEVFDLKSVPVLGDNPTEEQMELVRKGANIFCSEVEDEDEKQQCAADYFAQHNLDEEPSCD
jgi:hypothetical protein